MALLYYKRRKLKRILLLPWVFIVSVVCGQKADSIYFHLYTDSLKKGTHNYINVDGKLSNGRYIPLTDKDLFFWSNTGVWEGNDLIIDSFYKKDSVLIKATLKSNPQQAISIILYLKKSLYEGELRPEKDLLDNKGKRKNN
ncbi:hypothetical protein BH10BAC2_BH10BAC2_19300 [soil metagenome]